ncbi:MAG: hypothetical protein NTX15_01455 [Candidatus Kapabacteria bacterium]|nr:hypothetical protein [Candidatus Kapabacteria bacterium]
MKLLYFTIISMLLFGCATNSPVTPGNTCDVTKYQPLAVGKWWVYERVVDLGSGAVETDSFVIDRSTKAGDKTVFFVQRFTNGTLQSTLESTVSNGQLLEMIPGMFNNLLTPKDCQCPDARGAVLSCATSLPGVRGSRPADSILVVDGDGNPLTVITQYRWSTAGSHTDGIYGQLSTTVLQPAPQLATSIRTVNIAISDSVVIVDPPNASFTNGKRVMAGLTVVSRTYLFGVGLLTESLNQEYESMDSPSGPRKTVFTRRLRSYGTR